MEKKKHKVTILNEEYSLVSDVSYEHITQAAVLVDRSMRDVLAQGFSDKKRVALLVSLQLASKLIELEQEQTQQNNQQKELLDRLVRAGL